MEWYSSTTIVSTVSANAVLRAAVRKIEILSIVNGLGLARELSAAHARARHFIHPMSCGKTHSEGKPLRGTLSS